MVSTNGIKVDTMEASQAAKRRRHDASLKQEVLEQCAAPGASVASIALAHGLNANLVHKWSNRAITHVLPARPLTHVICRT